MDLTVTLVWSAQSRHKSCIGSKQAKVGMADFAEFSGLCRVNMSLLVRPIRPVQWILSSLVDVVE